LNMAEPRYVSKEERKKRNNEVGWAEALQKAIKMAPPMGIALWI